MASQMDLKRFGKDEIYISREDAYAVLRFYFQQISVLPDALTDRDSGFAQALLLEGIDASYEFGLVKLVYDTFYMKVPRDFHNLYGMAKDFAKKAAKAWWKHASQKDLEDPQIYEYVRTQIQSNFITTWKIREQTGDLAY
jgi:hypothetical protein